MTYGNRDRRGWRLRAGAALVVTIATVATSLAVISAAASADSVGPAKAGVDVANNQLTAIVNRSGHHGWGSEGTTTTSYTSTSTSVTSRWMGEPPYWRLYKLICTIYRQGSRHDGHWFWRITRRHCRLVPIRGRGHGYPTTTTTTVPTTTTSSSTTTTTSSTTTSSTTTTTPPSTSCTAPVTGTALSRTGWVASSNAPSSSADAPANALDGNLSTRFSTDENQKAGLYYEVNLGEPQSFNQLEMEVPNSPTDYAVGYKVQVSGDGVWWATVATCSGTGTPEVVSFPTQTAQYVRVVLTQSGSYWWSIDEFYLYGTLEALSRAGWVASSNTTPSSADAPANALDGNLSTRFSTDAYQAVGQYFEVNMGSAQTFNALEMDVPNSPTDYARAYDVEVSSNGTSPWTTVASGTGTGPTETIVFPTQTAQYVKVVLTTADSTYWWSIDEFNLYTTSS